jgi:RNA polymerase sigma factor (sigma-70 family)
VLKSKVFKSVENPLVKGFVENSFGKKLLNDYFQNPSAENEDKLNDGFKSHYLRIKALSYFGKTLTFEAKHFDKRRRKIAERYAALLDAPIGEDDMTMKDNIQDATQNTSEIRTENWEEEITNKYIQMGLEDLTERQKEAIKFSFFEGMRDKEIAEKLGISPQSVSKTKLAALKKLKGVMNVG